MAATPTTPTEGRALSAALSAPVPFRTRVGAGLLHTADRHVGRLAPEVEGPQRRGGLAALSFVDRLVVPWVMAAQQSASLRMFGEYIARGPGQRAGGAVSWVFPRPWYQDELDWMAAAREGGPAMGGGAQNLFTTRGTFESRVAPSAQVAPSALEYVAPSLASPVDAARAWSPLYGADAMANAQLMQAAVDASGGGAAQRFASTALAAMAPAVMTAPSTQAAQVRAAGSVPALRARLAALVAAQQDGGAAPTTTRLVGQVPSMVMPSVVADGFGSTRDDAMGELPSQPAAARAAEGARQAEAIRQVEAARAAEASRGVDPRLVEAARAAAVAAETARAQRTSAARPDELAAAREAAQRQADSDARERAAVARATEIERAHHALRYAEAQRAAVDTQRAIVQQMEQAQRAAVAQRAEAQAQQAASAPAAAVEAQRAAIGLRMVELLARGVESGHAPAPIAGPRVALPAGLGGLVAATGPAAAVGAMSIGRAMPAGAWLPSPPVAIGRAGEAAPPRQLARTAPTAPTLALPAVMQDRPHVLEHVAWADRWLGRLAGAQPRALAAFDAATSAPSATALRSMPARVLPSAMGAPMPVFVAPSTGEVSQADAEAAMIAQAEARAHAPAPAAPAVVRFDDADVTPDEVLFAIAAARSSASPRARASEAAPSAPAPVAAAAATARTGVPGARVTPADAVLTSVPLAPGAGFAPALASSPIASALASLMPLPPAASFDVRALFGTELASAYLGGMLAPSAFAVDAHGALATERAADGHGSMAPAYGDSIPGLGRFAPGAAFATSARAFAAPSMDVVAPSDFAADVDTRYFDLTAPAYAAPFAAARAPHADGGGAAMTLRPALLAPQPTAAPAFEAAEWSSAVGPLASAAAVASLPGHYPMSAFGDDAEAAAAAAAGPDAFWSASAEGGAATAPLWSGRPGMTAERSRRFAAHTQHTAADLALDFVSPELVLAARVYGLSPADAAQATRLATGGATALQILAGQVELTFLRALAGDAELRGDTTRAAHGAFAAPGSLARAGADAGFGAGGIVPTTAYPIDAGGNAAHSATTATAAAGLTSALPPAARRTPRGAFLWPAATVGAVGMHAPSPDGEGALSIAALELLAAGAVAQLGTYAITQGATAEEAAQVIMARGGIPMPTVAGPGGVAAMAPAMAGSTAATASIDATDADAVAMASATTLSTPERARFQALYVALAQSATGRDLTPVARAARALAMTARGDDAAAMSTRERAALAWSMMPVVEGGALSPDVIAALTGAGFDASTLGLTGASSSSVAPSAWSMRAPDLTSLSLPSSGPGYADEAGYSVDGRPGLAPLSYRAGEALQSYVTPLAAPVHAPAPSAPAAPEPSASAASTRAPSTEVVRAARGRYGGGEVEIPSWFENAARKMLENRGAGEGISLAELTLVTAAPSTQVAHSSRAMPAASASPSTSTAPAKPGMPDIEKLAEQVYEEFLELMQSVRMRNNGEP